MTIFLRRAMQPARRPLQAGCGDSFRDAMVQRPITNLTNLGARRFADL